MTFEHSAALGSSYKLFFYFIAFLFPVVPTWCFHLGLGHGGGAGSVGGVCINNYQFFFTSPFSFSLCLGFLRLFNIWRETKKKKNRKQKETRLPAPPFFLLFFHPIPGILLTIVPSFPVFGVFFFFFSSFHPGSPLGFPILKIFC